MTQKKQLIYIFAIVIACSIFRASGQILTMFSDLEAASEKLESEMAEYGRKLAPFYCEEYVYALFKNYESQEDFGIAIGDFDKDPYIIMFRLNNEPIVGFSLPRAQKKSIDEISDLYKTINGDLMKLLDNGASIVEPIQGETESKSQLAYLALNSLVDKKNINYLKIGRFDSGKGRYSDFQLLLNSMLTLCAGF